MARINDPGRNAIVTIDATDVLLITDVNDDAVDKKITMSQIAAYATTDISGKQDLITSPTNNNVVLTDGTGQTIDGAIASTALTTQGNTFNGTSQLVQTNGSGQLPALDGSLLTGISGGVSEFDSLGETTTDITLGEDVITTAYFSGTNEISLPTITDTANQVVCIIDFTTDSTSQPTINKYIDLTGTFAVTNASTTVTGTSSLLTDEVVVGSKIDIEGTEYTIDSVTSDTAFEITESYAGSTDTGLTLGRNIIKWSDGNNGIAPTSYSVIAGVRNIITFKTIWVDGLIYWQAKYETFGGVVTNFIRPNLTADGTMGGSEFAVSSTNLYSGGSAYIMYDGSTSSASFSTELHDDMFYNPDPLNVTALEIKYLASYGGLGVSIYGSNDGVTYTFLKSYASTANTFNIDLSTNTEYYKYYKISTTDARNDGTRWCYTSEINMTSTLIAT